MPIFNINPDIARAETLSAEFYTDERYFEQSKEKIFARTWHLIETKDEINNLRPYTILEAFLDEPVLITKNGEEFKCLSNVCTHRGKILIETPCKARGIRCGYHGRRFSLDGKFLSMPEFEGVENFPSEKDDLPQVPFGTWEKFLFVSVRPIAPLEDFLAPIRENLQAANLENLQFVSARDYTVKAHWALYCENYLEGFHIPFVHQSLNEAIDYGSYTTETFRFSSLQKAETRPSGSVSDVLEPPASAAGFSPDAENLSEKKSELQITNYKLQKQSELKSPFDQAIAALYFFIFPNLMFNFYPWGLSVNIVKPLKPDLTKVSYLTFVSDESKLNRGAGADLDRVELEDQAVVESVQRGIRSRFYTMGRYSPSRERGTHHFHRLIAEFMKKD